MDVGNWILQTYVRLQWKYCIASAEISRAIPSALLMRLYDPLHETSYYCSRKGRAVPGRYDASSDGYHHSWHLRT